MQYTTTMSITRPVLDHSIFKQDHFVSNKDDFFISYIHFIKVKLLTERKPSPFMHRVRAAKYTMGKSRCHYSDFCSLDFFALVREEVDCGWRARFAQINLNQDGLNEQQEQTLLLKTEKWC